MVANSQYHTILIQGEKKSAFATSKVKAAVPVLPLRTEAY
ncbi:unnamed protein product [Oncorhynchus mykiss]|uniref:Uncharacterized protein n=1 Tax=Oncorhynchus mykiss TaxID=8022 RepID=A0A060WIP4_ONCMY|nr:unnamed protein product [Oncorhynchus mykiss]